MKTFIELGLESRLLRSIADMGFEMPMPIQEEVIPHVLSSKKDLIGLAQTGTGKTAAFGLPLIQLVDPKNVAPQVLVLSPTRELCIQIAEDFKTFCKYIPEIKILSVYGGADIERQIRALKKGVHIIVATPGRMNDLLNRKKIINFSGVQKVVLDEADEMLNMGFKEELDAILEKTPKSKTTLLFSATMPSEVLDISKNYMNKPKEITMGVRNSGAENVNHFCYMVRSRDRYLALKRIVDFNPNIYGIIFCRTRRETQEVADKLIQDGYNADALHGDLSQKQREHVMHKFRIKNLQMLVATDVAARGLDVSDISHIINYNLPDENAVYTHRSGRTGRAGKTGKSIAIVNMKEKYKIRQIESKLKKSFKVLPVPGGKEICEKQLFNLVDKMQTIEVDHKEIDTFLPTVYTKLEWLSREDLIKNFVSLEFNRFLDYYKDTADLNAPDEDSGAGMSGRRRSRGKPPRKGTAEKGFTRLFINLGLKDDLTPQELMGLINRCVRKKKVDIGRIDLLKTYSFFEVNKDSTEHVLKGFRGVEFHNRDVVVERAQELKKTRSRSASRTRPASKSKPATRSKPSPRPKPKARKKTRRPARRRRR